MKFKFCFDVNLYVHYPPRPGISIEACGPEFKSTQGVFQEGPFMGVPYNLVDDKGVFFKLSGKDKRGNPTVIDPAGLGATSSDETIVVASIDTTGPADKDPADLGPWLKAEAVGPVGTAQITVKDGDDVGLQDINVIAGETNSIEIGSPSTPFDSSIPNP